MGTLKTIASFLIWTLLSCANSKNNTTKEIIKPIDPFSKIDFDKVVAYDFPVNTDIPFVDTNGVITNTVTKEVMLDSNQIIEFKKILTDSATFGGNQSKDFYSHFGIVFYKNKKIIQYLEISLPSNGVFGTFDLPGKNDRDFMEAGFSEKGRDKIYDFYKNLGFTHCLDKKHWCCQGVIYIAK